MPAITSRSCCGQTGASQLGGSNFQVGRSRTISRQGERRGSIPQGCSTDDHASYHDGCQRRHQPEGNLNPCTGCNRTIEDAAVAWLDRWRDVVTHIELLWLTDWLETAGCSVTCRDAPLASFSDSTFPPAVRRLIPSTGTYTTDLVLLNVKTPQT